MINPKDNIRAQLLFHLISAKLNISADCEVLVELVCGSHKVITEKPSQLLHKLANIDQTLKVVTGFKYDKNKQEFKQKQAKLTVMLLYKKVLKKGGKVEIELSEYLNNQAQSVLLTKQLIKCPDNKAELHFQLSFKQEVIDLPTQIPNSSTKQEIFYLQNKIKQFESQQSSSILKSNTVCNRCSVLEKQLTVLKTDNENFLKSEPFLDKYKLLESKYKLLENEIRMHISKEQEFENIKRTLELQIFELENELCNQKQRIAQIMQKCLQYGDPIVIEILEEVM